MDGFDLRVGIFSGIGRQFLRMKRLILLGAVLGFGFFVGADESASSDAAGEVAGGVRVPQINGEGVMTSLLTGKEVRFRPRQPMEITILEIFFYESDGKTVRMNATSLGCFYDSIRGKAFSDEAIQIDGSEFVITGTRYEYIASAQTMEIFEDVKVVLKNANIGAVSPTATDLPPSPENAEAPTTSETP